MPQINTSSNFNMIGHFSNSYQFSNNVYPSNVYNNSGYNSLYYQNNNSQYPSQFNYSSTYPQPIYYNNNLTQPPSGIHMYNQPQFNSMDYPTNFGSLQHNNMVGAIPNQTSESKSNYLSTTPGYYSSGYYNNPSSYWKPQGIMLEWLVSLLSVYLNYCILLPCI